MYRGTPQSNQFDSIIVVDIEREFRSFLVDRSDVLPNHVLPEVVERVLGIATELALEGREGHSVGCLFTLGDAENKSVHQAFNIKSFSWIQKEEDRNILNPFMDEIGERIINYRWSFRYKGRWGFVFCWVFDSCPRL